MASRKQTIKLYWVTTQDHDEDWFIFAKSAREARRFHEDYEVYDTGDARARLIVRIVGLTNGEPPCHAQMPDLRRLGFTDAGSVPNRRSVRFEGKTYTEGDLESLVELGRKNLALVLKNARLESKEASPQMPPWSRQCSDRRASSEWGLGPCNQLLGSGHLVW